MTAADRASAELARSSTRKPAPSPRLSPAERVYGEQAAASRAPRLLKPLKDRLASGSTPPTSTASASPAQSSSSPYPIATAPAAQALDNSERGPVSPRRAARTSATLWIS